MTGCLGPARGSVPAVILDARPARSLKNSGGGAGGLGGAQVFESAEARLGIALHRAALQLEEDAAGEPEPPST